MNRENKPNLSQSYAEFRSKQVSNVAYNLSFNLSHGKEKFSGISKITFDYQSHSEVLTIDFREGKVTQLLVNNENTEIVYNGNYISINPSVLKSGENQIDVHFEHSYSSDGAGLYRFEDQEDQTTYIYSNFEPYDANKMFPCFDQPDLKASYQSTVLAPKQWEVISATRESLVEVQGENKQWTFPKSKKFSTYIFSLHAGDYTHWTSDYNGMALRIFARKSLAKYINKDFWFDITKKGFEFFNRYFDYDYPFEKYDQVIVPDFNAGAMENTAAITFSERYIRKGTYTRADKLGIAEVILHEMAHMWFGNLVTMKWWNDLWLNESFATYMSYVAMAENTEFKEAWHNFYSDIKTWAYSEDQRVTTHPIEATIESTDQAFANFDGITYGKGGSSLKQIAYYIGADHFRDGMRHYFKTYAYQNTQLTDFVESLEKGAQKSLQNWVEDWLRNKGLNTVKADLGECASDQDIQSFDLIQGVASGDDVMRSHKTNVVLYKMNGNTLEHYANETVQYDGQKTSVKKLIGKECPDFVLINEADHDFVKVQFDKASVEFLKKNLNKFESAHHRSMIWRSLWDMVNDQVLSIQDYLAVMDTHLSSEQNVDVATQITDTLYGRRVGHTSVLYFVQQDQSLFNRLVKHYENFFWEKLNAAQAQSDFQSLWYTAYVKSTRSVAGQEKLLNLLKGTTKVKGLDLDQDKRWLAITNLSALKHEKALELIVEEEKRDQSAGGEKSSMAAKVIYPDMDSKNTWYNKLIQGDIDSLAKKKVVMTYLLPPRQHSFKAAFDERLYAEILKKNKAGENEFLNTFTIALAPVVCEENSVKALHSFIQKHQSSFSPVVKKNLLNVHEAYENCIAIRKANQL